MDRIDRESRSVFDMRGMRAGQPYTAFMEHDSLGRRLRHFVYEKNPTDYIVVSLAGDSVTVRQESKEVKLVRRKETAKIDKTNNSLWNATIAAGMPASIPMRNGGHIRLERGFLRASGGRRIHGHLRRAVD